MEGRRKGLSAMGWRDGVETQTALSRSLGEEVNGISNTRKLMGLVLEEKLMRLIREV